MKLTPYTLPLLRPEIPKDHLSRYILPHPTTGKPTNFTRATTIAKTLGDTSQLEAWSKRNIVEGLLVDPSALGAIDLNSPTVRADLDAAVERLTEASGANVRRERGSQLHYFIEAVTIGFCTLEQVPPEYQREVHAALTTVAGAGISYGPENVERTVYVPEANIVGTIDVGAATMPNGMSVNLDWKSGSSLYFDGIAQQLALYAHAELMLEWDHTSGVPVPTWVPAPKVDQRVAVVVHVPVDSGTATLYQVDIEAGWDAVLVALKARKYLAAAKRKGVVGAPLDIEKWTAAPTVDPKFAPIPTSDHEADASAFALGPPTTVDVKPGPALDAVIDSVFGDVPADTEDNNTWAETPGDVDPTEKTAIDEARARFQSMRARADVALEAWKDAGHKKRKKVMIKADEQASLVDDGVPSVTVYDAATNALAEAYGLGVDPVTEPVHVEAVFTGEGAPDTSVADAPDQLELETDGKSIIELEVERHRTNGEQMCLPCNGWFPESTFKDGVHYATIEGTDKTHAHPMTGPRIVEPVANPFVDPPIDDAVSEVSATVRDALDHCETRADMGLVFTNFSSVWTDELTEYGNAVLASKGK